MTRKSLHARRVEEELPLATHITLLLLFRKIRGRGLYGRSPRASGLEAFRGAGPRGHQRLGAQERQEQEEQEEQGVRGAAWGAIAAEERPRGRPEEESIARPQAVEGAATPVHANLHGIQPPRTLRTLEAQVCVFCTRYVSCTHEDSMYYGQVQSLHYHPWITSAMYNKQEVACLHVVLVGCRAHTNRIESA